MRESDFLFSKDETAYLFIHTDSFILTVDLFRSSSTAIKKQREYMRHSIIYVSTKVCEY